MTDAEKTREAVKLCLKHYTGGTVALAAIIMHCYNHTVYPFDVTDICALDETRQELAWAVLRLRVNGQEPHEVCDPGDFDRLKECYGAPRGRVIME